MRGYTSRRAGVREREGGRSEVVKMLKDFTGRKGLEVEQTGTRMCAVRYLELGNSQRSNLSHLGERQDPK